MELLLMATTEVAKWEPSSAAAVIEQLEMARTLLREMTIEEVREALPQAEAIRMLVRKRDLGREAELAAAEIVQRCNRRLGELWLTAREEGRALGNGDAQAERRGERPSGPDGRPKLKSSEVFTSDGARTDCLAMAAVNEDDFEETIAELRSTGVMTRAAVVRKLKRQPEPAGPRSEWHHRKRHLDPRRIVTESIAALDGVASALELIGPEVVDPADGREWSRAMRAATLRIESWRRGMPT